MQVSCFQFCKVVQKHYLGEVGNYTIFPVPGRKVSKKVYFLRNLPAENYYFSDAYSSYR